MRQAYAVACRLSNDGRGATRGSPRDLDEEVQCPRKTALRSAASLIRTTRPRGPRSSSRAEIAFGGKVVRAAQGTLTRPRGRPKKADAKVHIHIRLSPQVLGYFRATEPGWQTRIDEVLRKWVAEKGGPKRAA